MAYIVIDYNFCFCFTIYKKCVCLFRSTAEFPTPHHVYFIFFPNRVSLIPPQGIFPTTRDKFGRLVLGDIVTAINGQEVKNGSDLYRILDRCKVGDTVGEQ